MQKISVIIPVYNVEPFYIQEAINSVLKQSYENIEIIIVNDGSENEETLKYLSTINNPKIKIINEEHKCVGGARNVGIENSTGEYIGFLDADDWLDSKFYEVLYNLCEKNNADIACGVLTEKNNNRTKAMDKFKNVVVTNFIDKIKYIKNGSISSKLFKKELISDIRFEENTYYEDNLFLIKTLIKSNKVAFTNSVKYYYRKNLISICHNPEKEEKRKNDKFFILNKLCEMIKDWNPKEKEALLYVITPILITGEDYAYNEIYREKINNLLGENHEKYLQEVENSLPENIFSIKNAVDKTYKIVTILWIKFKIKRKIKRNLE